MKVYEIIKGRSDLAEGGKLDAVKDIAVGIKNSVVKWGEKIDWLKWKKTPPEVRKAPDGAIINVTNGLGGFTGKMYSKTKGKWYLTDPVNGIIEPDLIEDKGTIGLCEHQAIKEADEKAAKEAAEKGVVDKIKDAAKNNPKTTGALAGTGSTGLAYYAANKWLFKKSWAIFAAVQQAAPYGELWRKYYDEMDGLEKEAKDGERDGRLPDGMTADQYFDKRAGTLLAQAIAKTSEMVAADVAGAGFTVVLNKIMPGKMANLSSQVIRLAWKNYIMEDPEATPSLVTTIVWALGLENTVKKYAGYLQGVKLGTYPASWLVEHVGIAYKAVGAAIDKYGQKTPSSTPDTPASTPVEPTVTPGGAGQADTPPPAPASTTSRIAISDEEEEEFTKRLADEQKAAQKAAGN